MRCLAMEKMKLKMNMIVFLSGWLIVLTMRRVKYALLRKAPARVDWRVEGQRILVRSESLMDDAIAITAAAGSAKIV
nr:MAG TPA: hypothetical protein [Caudoviricetes sp.]